MMPTPGPRPRGDRFAWIPDGVALAAGAFGAASLSGVPRWLCGAAAGAALASLGLRTIFGDRSAAPNGGRSLLASVPALILLTGLIFATHAAHLERTGLAPPETQPPTVALKDAPPEAQDCLASEGAKAYLDALYQRLQETWDAQAASDEGGFVVLGFVLDPKGGIRLSRVIDQSSDTYRGFGMQALAEASPFGLLTGELACLARLELRATLDRAKLR